MEKYELNILGVIPARGGSKGVLKKNVRLILGKPLIAYTISEALKSEMLTKVIVSSDDDEIIEIAKEYGAEVPFKRPKELATDSAQSLPVIQHAVRFMEELEGITYDYVVMLQPTTPLRRVEDIDASVKFLLERKAESLITLSPVLQHPYYMYYVDENSKARQFIEFDEAKYKKRQDFPKIYIRNGAVYAAKRDFLLNNNCLYNEDSLAYVMPQERGINIDEKIDWEIAEALLGR